MHRLLLVILIAFSTCILVKSQNNLFQKEIEIISKNSDSLAKATSDSIKLKLNDEMMAEMIRIASSAKSFKLPLNSLKYIGKIYSPDENFRIISWDTPLTDGTYKYNCIIQMNPVKDSICKYFILNDSSKNYKGNISSLVFNTKKWYGAVYYEVLQCKVEGKTIYVLLAKHFNDLFSNRKIIESMYFDNAGNPVFGYPIFRDNNIRANRIVFDYSINASMMMRYDQRLDMIVFDHLAPPSNIYAGNYKFYGPDFSFDGFKFEKNSWIFQSNVNFRDFDKAQNKNKFRNKKARLPGIK
jgi:hypothetical protein